MFLVRRSGLRKGICSQYCKVLEATFVSASELRNEFLHFYESKNHVIVPGSSVIPEDDPSLLFVNAGMNQFKKFYLGEAIPRQRRVTTSQLCIRAGGKHNDLDNIGFTPRHQTMFEMLGNFSLGDYYREEAIAMAFEFVNKVIGIPRDHLRVSVHDNDGSARSLWKSIAGFRDDQIVSRGDADNFWSMGSDDSPSGYCSEIFYTTDPHSSYDQWLEIWNIVFMNTQNQGGWIDTGMGCERMLSVLNNVPSNFDTDIFSPIVSSFHAAFPQLETPALHVFADHLRTSVVLGNSIFPASKGRGYVMRKIFRRMLRFAYLGGINEPFAAQFVPEIVGLLEKQVPSLRSQQKRIQTILENEEEFFWRAVTDGKKLFSAKFKKNSQIVNVETMQRFRSDTGLPIDMITTLLDESHILYDKNDVSSWMNRDTEENENTAQHEKWGIPQNEWEGRMTDQKVDYAVLTSSSPSSQRAKIQAISRGEKADFVLLDSPPFFPTQAGQEGDKGVLLYQGKQIPVLGTVKYGRFIVNVIDKQEIDVNAEVECVVDVQHRRNVARHHTATHLLHACLGKESHQNQSLQAGSRITDKEFSFDFYTGFLKEQMRSPQQFLRSIQSQMNDLALQGLNVLKKDYTTEEIRKQEKGTFIGDVSRIAKNDEVFHTVSIGSFSHEYCCGQHAQSTSDLYPVVITGIQSISAGIKRITGMAGNAASELLLQQHLIFDNLLHSLGCSDNDIEKKIDLLQKQVERMKMEQSAIIRFVSDVITPNYEIPLSGQDVLQVYEVPKEVPKEMIEKLIRKDSHQLFLQDKSFTLVCKRDVEANKIKDILFDAGNGGKGGGKKGIVKGVCGNSLIHKKELLLKTFRENF